ncbi:MAG: DUF58 domain-containing protein, partial [Verrucomicrobiota bacterium]
MIAPRSRFILFVAVIVLPFATVATAVPSLTPLSLIVILGFTGLVLSDLFAGMGHQSRGTGIYGIEIETPDVSRLTQNREGLLEISIRRTEGRLSHFRLGLALPPEITTPHEDQWIRVSSERSNARMNWACTPLRRGCYPLENAYLEMRSRLGFWAIRRACPLNTEIRVYPNLLHERRNLATLFMSRGDMGIHAQRQVGKGRDFEQLREYIPGDSYEDIHWKATAKRGYPITKMYQIERTQEIYVLIDASRLSAQEVDKNALNDPSGTETVTFLERFITTALIMGMAAEKQGDHFGLITF